MYIKKGDSCRHYIWFVGEGVLLVMMTIEIVLAYVLLFFFCNDDDRDRLRMPF